MIKKSESSKDTVSPALPRYMMGMARSIWSWPWRYMALGREVEGDVGR
jgi:hypothetical protein